MTVADLTVPDLLVIGLALVALIILSAVVYSAPALRWQYVPLFRDIADTSTVDVPRPEPWPAPAVVADLERDASYRVARAKQNVVDLFGPNVSHIYISAFLELAVEHYRDHDVPRELLLAAVLYVYDGQSAEGQAAAALFEGRC